MASLAQRVGEELKTIKTSVYTKNEMDAILADFTPSGGTGAVTGTSTAPVQFDGDEVSQNRLHRAFTVADKKGINIPWKTYNNDIIELSSTQILDILHKAGQAQTELWF